MIKLTDSIIETYKPDQFIYEFLDYEEDHVDWFSEDTIIRDIHNSIYVAIFPTEDRNFDVDPYIKISWQSNFDQNDKVARLSIKNGRYIIHYNQTALVTNKVIKYLNINMKKECKNINIINAIKNTLIKDQENVFNDEIKYRTFYSEQQKNAVINKQIKILKDIEESKITMWDVMLYDIRSSSNIPLYILKQKYPIIEFYVPSCPKGTTTYKWGKGAE